MVHTYPKAREAINLGIIMDQLYLIFSNRRIFRRRRIDPYMKAIAVKAYVKGLSLRGVSNLLREIGYRVSHESIGRCF